MQPTRQEILEYIRRHGDHVDGAEVSGRIGLRDLGGYVGYRRAQIFAEPVLRKDTAMRESEHGGIVVMSQKDDGIGLPGAKPRLREIAFAEDGVAQVDDLTVPARLVASDPHDTFVAGSCSERRHLRFFVHAL